MNFAEQVNDITDVIREVSKHMGIPLTDLEMKNMGRRLARYHGQVLFSTIMALHDKQFFPSGAELEQQVRRAMGMDPAKGLSEEQIEKNRKELIAAGQDPRKAEGGAAMARSTLRIKAAEKFDQVVAAETLAVAKDYLAELEGDLFSTIEVKEQDPLAELESF